MTLKPTPIRVMLVDDHEVVRIGLRSVLQQKPRIHLVGEADNIMDARTMAADLHPQVILMDVRLPDGSGVDACRDILSRCPDTRVIFLTSYEDEDSMLAAVVAGASGYLLKEVGSDRLLQVIEMVAEGHSILDHSVVQRVQEWMKGQEGKLGEEKKPTGLSPQQERVLSLVAEGKTNKEIAVALDLSDKTVRNYLSIVFEKLQITRRTQAAAFFVKRSTEQ